MKKVNLINKKIMSTGLASSLLVATLGATPCSAYGSNNTVVRKALSSSFSASLTKKPSQPKPISKPQNFTITKEPVKTTNSTGTSAENSNNSSETDKEKVETKNNLQISMPNSFEKQKLAVSDVDSFENTQNVSENEKEVTKVENEEKNSEVDTELQIKNEENIPAQAKIEDENNQETQINEKENLHDKLDTEKTNSISKTKVEDENNQETELEPQVNEDKKPSDKLDTKKNDSMSKKEMAKTAAKVVAVAAIVGAATYFGYKYRTHISESLTKGNSYGTNKANSIIDKCKNIFNKSKKSANPLQMEYSNASLINGTSYINQSELWKRPLEKQSLVKQLKNEITSKAITAFKYIESFLNIKSACTYIKNLFINNDENNNETSAINSHSFVRSNCSAILPKGKLILPEPIKESELPTSGFWPFA